MNKFITLILIICCFALPTLAQEAVTINYNSEDSAVQFDYPSDWMLETQLMEFNNLYRYLLWNPPRTGFNLYLGSETHSRIILDIRNTDSPDFSDDVVTLQAFADFALTSRDYTIAETAQDTAEVEVAGNEAVRISLSHPPEHRERLYVVMRDDGWVIIASLTAPNERVDDGEEVLLQILESIKFDAALAAVPFVRDLEPYDTGDIELNATFTSEDGSLIVQYPVDWEIDRYGKQGGYEHTVDMYSSYAVFALPAGACCMRIEVLDTSNDGLGLPLDQNTALEFMIARRNGWLLVHERISEQDDIIYTYHYTDETTITEFRIGEFDAVSSISHYSDDTIGQQITIALSDTWIAQTSIHGRTLEEVKPYEATAVAMLAALRFSIGESFITSPVLNADLPESWVYGTIHHDPDVYYQFVLRPTENPHEIGERIVIEVLNIEALDVLADTLRSGQLEDALQIIATVEGDPETLTIGEYQVMQARGVLTTGWLGEFRLFIVDEQWLVIVYATAETESVLQETALDLAPVIEALEFTLSEA